MFRSVLFIFLFSLASLSKADSGFTTFKSIQSDNFVEANFGGLFTVILPSKFHLVDSSGLDIALAMMEAKGLKTPRRNGLQLIKTTSGGQFLASITISELKMQFGQDVMRVIRREETRPYRKAIEKSVVKMNKAGSNAETEILNHEKITIDDENYFMKLKYRRSFPLDSEYANEPSQISESFRYFNFDKSFSIVFSYVEDFSHMFEPIISKSLNSINLEQID
jgi:hypothetical protein